MVGTGASVNVLYAINNGMPFVSLYGGNDNACTSATATYAGALGVCQNQGSTSYQLTCAIVASQTPSPSSAASTSASAFSPSTTITPTVSPSIFPSAAPNAYLCTAAFVNIFASSDCSGVPVRRIIPSLVAPFSSITHVPVGCVCTCVFFACSERPGWY